MAHMVDSAATQSMADPLSSSGKQSSRPLYGGFTRFELELEVGALFLGFAYYRDRS